MKILKIVLAIFLFANVSFCLEYRSIPFNDFLGELSGITGKNIVISGGIDTNFDVFLPTFDLSDSNSLYSLLKDILNVNNLDYKIKNDILLIYNPLPEKEPVLNDYIIKFKNISKDDVINALKLFDKNIKYSVYSDRILLLTTENQYNIIKSLINGLDTSYQLSQLSFTIIATDNAKLKEIGPNISVLLNPIDHFYFNIITNVFTLDSTRINKDSVTSIINLLEKKGVSKLIYNPRITLIDNKDSVIESVIKTPIKKTTISVENSQTVRTEDIEYQNVGLKLFISGVLITDYSVSFSLDLYIESLLDDTNTPRISSRHLKTNVYLTDQDSYLIGGITSKETILSNKSIPFISNIPFLGDLFKYNYSKDNDFSFSVFITLLPDPCKNFYEKYLNDDDVKEFTNFIDSLKSDYDKYCSHFVTSTTHNTKGAPRSGE